MKFWKTFCVLCLTLTMILSMAGRQPRPYHPLHRSADQ